MIMHLCSSAFPLAYQHTGRDVKRDADIMTHHSLSDDGVPDNIHDDRTGPRFIEVYPVERQL
jgi:hypothetical protein